MSIKRVKPTNKSGFIQGYFKPNKTEKYVGPEPIIYRSSWERKFMIWCDKNTLVQKWSSEPVAIPYWSKLHNKQRTYHPDFYIKVLKHDGTIDNILIEIKPHAQIQKPKPPTVNSTKALKNYKFLAEQYVINRDKYIAAQQFANERGWRFVVMTENSLK
tara:strand:- start:719 stop:1195 length:477 start_codon:yes stop_codon:yes gene_type:complete